MRGVINISERGENALLTLQCPQCKETRQLWVTKEALNQYQNGVLVQNAFPRLSADDREGIVTGTCPSCWAKMFGGEG